MPEEHHLHLHRDICSHAIEMMIEINFRFMVPPTSQESRYGFQPRRTTIRGGSVGKGDGV